MSDREDIERRTIDRICRFTEKLKSGVPIECTHVRVEQTPDGTLTTKRPGIVGEVPEEFQ